MHALIRIAKPGADIMPAILTVYNDDTYDMDVFHADIKTTIYRKITEVSQLIKNRDIRQICFMSLYSYISNVQNVPKTSKKRIASSANDILAFESIDQDLNEMEYVFEGKALSNINYVISVMKRGPKTKLELGRVNMSPIIQAFKSKKGK